MFYLIHIQYVKTHILYLPATFSILYIYYCVHQKVAGSFHADRYLMINPVK